MRSAFAKPIVVAAVLLSWAGPAHADLLSDGQRLYNEGDFERSVEVLGRAVASLPVGRERARAHLFRGLARAVLGQWPDARASFAAALADDPEIAPDRERVRPAIVAAFDAVRTTVTGRLEVSSDRPAELRVDGRVAGRTPQALTLSVGRHRLDLRTADGFAALTQEGVLVRAGETTRVAAALVVRAGLVTLRSDPPGAAVFEGSRKIATTPVAGLPLAAGAHRLTLRLAGHRDAEVLAQVNPDLPANLRVALVPIDARPFYKKRRGWAWITAGLSGALLATGVAFGVGARSAESEIATRARENTLDYDRLRSLTSTATDRARFANLFFAVGGAAAATSVLLFLWKDEAPKLGVAATPSGLWLSGRF